ncbi:MAG: cation-transporting P-type ATPase [Acidimicrobiales bacterium]
MLLVDGADHEALRAADVGLGLLGGRHAPWGADLLVPDLPAARFVVEAAGIAHEVSRQGNAFALGGSSIASVLALSSPEQDAGRRAATTVNTAALLSMANGVRAATSLARHPEPVLRTRTRWHEMSRRKVLAELESTRDGLTSHEAARRLPPTTRPLPVPLALARAMWLELANPMTPVMAGSAALSAVVGSPTDAGVVMSVILVGGVISGVQRFASESAVKALVAAGDVHAHVRRDGELVFVPADQLVPGDVVELVAGDTVPADCRILRAAMLEVDEASLTGESEPVAKGTAATFRALVAERSSMLYAGTSVVTGSASAVVVAVGRDTEAAAEVGDDDRPETGVEARMRELATLSLPVAGVSGAVLAASQLLRGLPVATALSSGISLAVAAVPEGLPMLATVGQLAVARRLARHNVLVRDPRAVEALGRIDVVCIDKTGTLTRGRIELSCVWDGVVELTGEDLERVVRASRVDGNGSHAGLVLAAALRASPEPDGERALPHFTDRAVRDGAQRLGVGTDDDGDPWARIAELPFGSDRPMHATWGRAGDEVLLSVKGAPEHLLPRSTTWVSRDGERRLDAATARRLADGVDRLARRGLRVLAVAERRLPAGHRLPGIADEAEVDELALLGFVGLADPVRPTAREAVDGLRAAGVDVVMVTGDHPSTAAGVAAELGILNSGDILSGADLAELSDADLDRALGRVTVFARVTPSDKVRIVKAYRRAGRPVGMTGDGANDANAIRLADAGIAVGTHCAPAARTAADVIITDSRIETILEAVVEGRALWAAVRDSLAILLGGNLGEIGFILASGGLTGHPSLSTRQVLLVNMFTDILPSLAIVASPPPAEVRQDLAREGPERSLGDQLQDAIVRRAEATTLGATSAWLLARSVGAGPRRAATVGLASVVGTQLGQTLLIGRRDPLVAAASSGRWRRWPP